MYVNTLDEIYYNLLVNSINFNNTINPLLIKL